MGYWAARRTLENGTREWYNPNHDPGPKFYKERKSVVRALTQSIGVRRRRSLTHADWEIVYVELNVVESEVAFRSYSKKTKEKILENTPPADIVKLRRKGRL